MIKIAFAGPPSSGKTMLARQTSVILKQIGCWADMVNEAHRSYLVHNVWPKNRETTAKDQYAMFCQQLDNEAEFEGVQSDYVLYEMPIFNDLIWLSFKRFDQTKAGQRYKTLMEKECAKRRYDFIFLCSPKNVPNVRQRVSIEDRFQIYELTREFIETNKPYKIGTWELEQGTFEEKANQVLKFLASQDKEIKDKLAKFRKENGRILQIT